jgi:DNA-binding LytR/AlgR family response regulator
MVTAIIIDDEPKGRIALKQKLEDYCPEIQLLGEAENGEEGIELITKHHPGIVFLDIEMPRMDGFGMLHLLTEKNFHLIFTTAYDQYAIPAEAHRHRGIEIGSIKDQQPGTCLYGKKTGNAGAKSPGKKCF